MIIVLVYLVLLRPEGGGPLFDVEAPGPRGNDRIEIARPPDARERRGRRGRGPVTQQVGEGPIAGLEGLGPPGGIGPGPADQPPIDTPSFDQYSSTLAQIRARLLRPSD